MLLHISIVMVLEIATCASLVFFSAIDDILQNCAVNCISDARSA